jgi:hypothetical protein
LQPLHLEKAQGLVFAWRAVEQLLQVFAVAPVTDVVLRRALVLAWPDSRCGLRRGCRAAGCDAIVSRDPAGFLIRQCLPHDPAAALFRPLARP